MGDFECTGTNDLDRPFTDQRFPEPRCSINSLPRGIQTSGATPTPKRVNTPITPSREVAYNGFRVDYALAAPSLLGQVKALASSTTHQELSTRPITQH